MLLGGSDVMISKLQVVVWNKVRGHMDMLDAHKAKSWLLGNVEKVGIYSNFMIGKGHK